MAVGFSSLRVLCGRWALLLALLWLPLLAARAQNIPARPNPPHLVNDLAGLMQPSEAEQLERKLVAYNDSTSSQIAVVTVPNLDGDEIAHYAQQLYQSWGIGQKSKNNGILVLVAAEEHAARIQTGYGLEGAVPDALAKRIITNTLVPAFRQNQYYAGLDRATDQLIALAKGEYQAEPGDVGRSSTRRDRGSSGPSFWVIIIILVIVFLFLRNRGGGSSGGRRRNRGFGGGFVPPIIFGDFSGGRGTFGGGGGWGGGGGGGFGGFGGGSSGGGGASGNW